jgi:hypothetical protein
VWIIYLGDFLLSFILRIGYKYKKSRRKLKMSEKKILICGEMYEMNMITVSEETIEQLIKARDSEEDLWDDLEEVHDEIMGDSLINGFTFNNDHVNFKIYVDGESQPELGKTFIKSLKDTISTSSDVTSNTAHYLVYEQWSINGSVSLSLDEDDFDLDNLDLSIETESLPDGTVRRVVDPYYDGEDFEFEGNTTKEAHLYVIKSDGSRIDLE